MSMEENKALARRMTEEVFNKKDMSLLDEFVDTNFVLHVTVGDFKGPEGFKQFLTTYFAGVPDMHTTIEDEIAEGDVVVHRTTVHGTQTGNFGGIPATGKQFTIMMINIIRFDNGKYLESWSIADLLGMMQQIGLAPSQ
jgi:steroid delta-isomerase-like uncharacterized protein